MKGRKNRYDSHIKPRLFEIECWARDGLLEVEICKRLGVGLSTFAVYKNNNQELQETLKTGKEIADYRVEESLYKRALGYKFDEVTKEPVIQKGTDGIPLTDERGAVITELTVTKIVTKEVQPDTTAQIFWLKNRRPDKWRDKRDIEHSGGITLEDALMELEDEKQQDKTTDT
jgi:hypothetical protein